jgi:hypothetical protein
MLALRLLNLILGYFPDSKIFFVNNHFEESNFESKVTLDENHFFSKVIFSKIIFNQKRFFLNSFSVKNVCSYNHFDFLKMTIWVSIKILKIIVPET